MTLVFKNHNGPTPADDIAPQIITDCGNLTLDFKHLGLWASPPFLQTPRTLVSKWNTKLAFIWKEEFGPLGNSPVLLLFSPGKVPLTTIVAKFLETYVCGGSWCLDPSLFVKVTQILESILLIQWVQKVFRPPYIFHSLLYCSHLLKPFKFILFLINVHTAPHIDRKTQNCWHFCRFIKKEKLKYHMVLSIQTRSQVALQIWFRFNTMRF